MSERVTNEVAVDQALDALRALGIAAGEVFLREAQSGSVEIKDGAIDSLIARGERGIGIRVLEEQRLGFAYTSDLSTDGIRACADTARRMSGVTEADKDLALATRPIDDADLDIYQAGIVNRALVERGNVALAVEDAARATDPRVTQFRKTTYSDSESTTIIATTTGMRGSYRESYCGAMTSAVATQDGERQIGYHGEAGRRFADLDPKRGVEQSGNARRGGYGSPSRVGTSNLYINAGTDDTAAIARGLDRALAITSLLNLHTIDPVSGEFSLGATGNYLERGLRSHPVQGITIAGNLTQLLGAIVAVGTDLVFGPSGLGSPTLVISELSIGGA